MCPGLQGKFAASLLETLRPAHGERRGLSAFPGRKEGWDFTLVLGRKTLPSLCCARCASKAPSATSPAPGELQWFSPGVLHCGVTRSWVWQVSPRGSAASAPWLPQLEARVTREPLCCQSHEGTVAWELPSSCLGATMAPGHRLALPARESPDVSAQVVSADPDGRDGYQRGRLFASGFQAVVLLPGEICWGRLKAAKSWVTSPLPCPQCS